MAERCHDCDEAAKHAYSDASTPGFFSPKCKKHRHGVASEPAPTLRTMIVGDAATLTEPAPTPGCHHHRVTPVCYVCNPAEPAVERPTERIAEMEKEWMAQTEYLDYTNWLNHKHLELDSELSSLRRERDQLKQELEDEYSADVQIQEIARLNEEDRDKLAKQAEELKAALRTYGRHKDTWKCMTGERACASISGGKCDCGFEQALGADIVDI